MSTSPKKGEPSMSTILLAVALQKWEQYSAHALAAREVAAALARGSSNHLHVLSVYDYEDIKTSGLPPEMVVNYREDQMRRTDDSMKQKLEEYVAPLRSNGLEITKILRVGDPREEIVKVATEIKADLLIIGTHSKRGLFDIFLGGTAQQVSKRAPCTLVLVSPKKTD
ncbi:MAG: universal stress protein [Nitrospinota bacterium]|nr:MAG: universal stress protein [Nitrospinota bacterium]